MTRLNTRSARGRAAFVRLTLLSGVLAGCLALGETAPASPSAVASHLYGITYGTASAQLVPFDIDAAGVISQRNDHAITIQGGAQSIVVGRDARTIYVGAPDHSVGISSVLGAIEAYSVASDGALSLLQRLSVQASQLALTPDGSRLFVRTPSWQIRSYAVAADGSLGAASPITTAGGGGAMAFVVKPDGSTLYASVFPSFLEQWAIGAGGSLTTLLPTDLSLGACQSSFLGVTPDSLGLDAMCNNPNGGFSFTLGNGGALSQNGVRSTIGTGRYVEDVRGRALYVGVYPHWVEQAQRQPNGTLAAFVPGSITDPGNVRSLAADPSGTRLVISSQPNALKSFAIAQDGSLSTSPVATLATTASYFDLLAFAPEQAPIAALSASEDAGSVTFDASGSHAVNGTIARYDWNFGDGTALADAGPTASHLYPSPGDYTATVTVTDSTGCSVTGTFDGAKSVCAGSTAAAAGKTVRLTATTAIAAPATTAASTTTGRARPTAANAMPNARGDKVLLTWREPDGGVVPIRYLLAWSTLHSAQGPGDPNMHHLYRTRPHILLRTRPGTTLHVAVYAQLADGTFTRATKTTVRLAR
jgi:hypothetical protein